MGEVMNEFLIIAGIICLVGVVGILSLQLFFSENSPFLPERNKD
jgi:hypothetical protein